MSIFYALAVRRPGAWLDGLGLGWWESHSDLQIVALWVPRALGELVL